MVHVAERVGVAGANWQEADDVPFCNICYYVLSPLGTAIGSENSGLALTNCNYHTHHTAALVDSTRFPPNMFGHSCDRRRSVDRLRVWLCCKLCFVVFSPKGDDLPVALECGHVFHQVCSARLTRCPFKCSSVVAVSDVSDEDTRDVVDEGFGRYGWDLEAVGGSVRV